MIPVQNTAARPGHQTRKGLLSDRRILIADDSAAIRFVAATALRAQGAIVHEVGNGKEAIAVGLTHTFSLVLMDVQMPLVDGFAATQRLRQAGLDELPILALTGTSEDEFETCITAGMNDIIPKPFTQSLLLSKVLSCLGCATAEIVAKEYSKSALDESVLFSTESLLGICGGDIGFVRRMLSIAVQELPFAAQQMRVAYANGYLDQVAKLAHRVRPCVEGLGIAGLPAKLLRTEALIAERANAMYVGPFVSAIADELEQIARCIIAAQ